MATLSRIRHCMTDTHTLNLVLLISGNVVLESVWGHGMCQYKTITQTTAAWFMATLVQLLLTSVEGGRERQP